MWCSWPAGSRATGCGPWSRSPSAPMPRPARWRSSSRALSVSIPARRNLVVREARRTGEIQVRLVTTPGSLDADGLVRAAEPVAGLLWTQTDSVAETTQDGETELLAGSEYLEEEIGGMRMRISSSAFFQTNTEM